MSIKILYIFLFSFTSQYSYTQVNIYENNEMATKATSKKNKYNLWKFKIDPLEMALAGAAKIYVEKNFGDYIALEMGAGITYLSLFQYFQLEASSVSPKDFLFIKVIETDPPDETYYNFIEDRSAKVSYTFSIFPKIYTDGDPLDGFYLGPYIEYKRFKYEFEQNEVPDFSSTIPYTFDRLGLYIAGGNTWDVSDLICIESLYGVGVGFVKDKRPMIYYLNNSPSIGSATFSKTRLEFMFGMRISFYID